MKGEGFTASYVTSSCLRGVVVWYSGKLSASVVEQLRERALQLYESALGGTARFVEFRKAGQEVG